MLKKSDIQALLDRLPDEIDADLFQSGIDSLNAPPLTEQQIREVVAAADRAEKEGAIPFEEFKKELLGWASSRSR